jgi:hypothetical protein
VLVVQVQAAQVVQVQLLVVHQVVAVVVLTDMVQVAQVPQEFYFFVIWALKEVLEEQ